MRLAKLLFSIFFTIIGWAGSAATLWAFFHEDDRSSGLYWTGLVAVLVITVVYICVQVAAYRRESKKVHIHSTEEKVNQYLYDWLKKSGHTVIFTRDFSWARCTDKMWALLKSKAEKKNLIVCLKEQTADTDALEKEGAEIYVHDVDNLQSRFIIANYGTTSPRITVGSKNDKGSFVNEQYNMQSSPNACSVFVELFESTKVASQQKVPQK